MSRKTLLLSLVVVCLLLIFQFCAFLKKECDYSDENSWENIGQRLYFILTVSGCGCMSDLKILPSGINCGEIFITELVWKLKRLF